LAAHGWIGKFLRVDLTKNETKIDSSTGIIKEFIGGRGFGQWILFRHLHPKILPLHPENLLIVSTGPLTGTMAPTSCRTSIDTKNLYTGGVLSSNCGGHIGPELKFAGFDFIIIEGASKSPKYILIKDGDAEIRDAKHLWGKNTWETEQILRKDLADKNLRVASIGIAGENLAKPACIIADRGRAAGRGGVGAIMGSKKLKAIAIRGTGGVKLAEPEKFMSEVNRVWDKIDQNKSTEMRRIFGTRAFLLTSNELGFLGVRNFQDDFWSLEKAEIGTFLENWISMTLRH